LIRTKTKWNILEKIKEKLETPYGLLSLSKDSEKFTACFHEDKLKSIHNGLIHPYIYMEYLISLLKMDNYSSKVRKDVKIQLEIFEKKLKSNIIGFLPQYINADEKNNSAGGLADSGSYAQYLRLRSEELSSI
jgi:glycogen debranching enzyme